MQVTLLTYTPEPEKTIATAAKLCYSSSDIGSLREGLTQEKTESFISMLASIGHESPMEHVSFTFGIEGISRACSHQLVRHRIASYSQKSQRYVNEGGFEYITPPAIEQSGEAKEEFDKQMNALLESYNKIADILTKENTKKLVADGMDEAEALKKAKKLAYEDARFVLPNACETKIVVTMNVRSLFNFFKHRCCNRAQWEIKAVADEMLRLCKSVAPHLFSNAGPSCVMTGRCPEGKMSCKKMGEVVKIYKELK
ncbi:MAG: FAD-dependent thymidylate synthase [Ruminococcus sp.]|nr:FAD-dependent thymidylate synthase [Ruminococcus sp.]MCD7727653.1 FAD-dependent thymidylate synthase [Ruminococcus sp.]